MNGIEYILPHLPPKLKGALESSVRFSGKPLSEVHICRGSGSSVRFSTKNVYLGVSLDGSDMDGILTSLTGGALYAHRDTLREGYLTLKGGIRIGVCGRARYEGGSLIGISEVSSLLIRFPSMECRFADKLAAAFLDSRGGLLIFAPPSGGKTTALRALIRRLSESRAGRISLIDERGEIYCDDFSSLDVDVFSGYRRSEGMQIALRVMSPEILAVDEIGSAEECEGMLESLFSGVRLIATAHAEDYETLLKRKSLAPFFEAGVFEVFAQILKNREGYDCKIYQ